ncbi:MAG: metallopeptidase family protein [Anaerolineae bacterium]|nr:metallopeptidase family protein [Anaerolineae bacterium]
MATLQIFEQFVAEALDALPDQFREKLNNVDVVIAEWPDRRTLELAKVRHPAQLLGFYHGIPQTRRTQRYGLVLPDKITLYRRPILMRCRTLDEVRDMVHHVLRHEIAHHFGISDARLQDLGAY